MSLPPQPRFGLFCWDLHGLIGERSAICWQLDVLLIVSELGYGLVRKVGSRMITKVDTQVMQHHHGMDSAVGVVHVIGRCEAVQCREACLEPSKGVLDSNADG